MECAPQHVYAQTQISSVLGLSVLSLWGFPDMDTKILVIDRPLSADLQSSGSYGLWDQCTKREGGVSLWAMTDRKQARCVVHFHNPSTWMVKASSGATWTTWGYVSTELNRRVGSSQQKTRGRCWKKEKRHADETPTDPYPFLVQWLVYPDLACQPAWLCLYIRS